MATTIFTTTMTMMTTVICIPIMTITIITIMMTKVPIILPMIITTMMAHPITAIPICPPALTVNPSAGDHYWDWAYRVGWCHVPRPLLYCWRLFLWDEQDSV